ncbi:MAG: DUF1661 domain-containing protein [Porphyromonas gingivalis]
MARKIFTSHAKTKKFPNHVFPNAKPPFLRTDVYVQMGYEHGIPSSDF